MAATPFRTGPKLVHPETPSAVGSRNSLNRDGRDEYSESRLLIDEEVDKILNHVSEKLPPEVLSDLKVMGNIKSHLHTYFNQSFQYMSNRYLVTVEDELGKKIRDMLDKDENKLLNRYSAREMSELVDRIGGSEKFNTGEVEKSMVNIMGHLMGHINRGSVEFEKATTNILMQRTDVGGAIQGENCYSVIKASFRDNYQKPDKVVDVKLAINVLETELISFIVPFEISTENLIKEIIGKQIATIVEKEVEDINKQLEVEGRKRLSDNESFFEKIKAVENYADDSEADNSKRYQFVSKKFLDRIKGMGAEVEKIDFEQSNAQSLVAKFLEHENLHNRGWSSAVNALTTILDSSRLGYQFINNSRDSRRLELREYELTDISKLPDERYKVSLRYLDHRKIKEEQAAYSAQVHEFRREIMRLWDVVERIYLEEKQKQKIKDWNDLLTRAERVSGNKSGWFGGKEDSNRPKWNEISFIQRRLNTLEEMNQTYERLLTEFKERFRLVRARLKQIFPNSYPEHRIVVEQRLNFLESTFLEFMSTVNPYHVQPGLVMEVDMTSIKRGKTTIKSMANVLNEYLSMVSRGFNEAHETTKSHRHANINEAIGAFGSSKAEG